MKSISKQQSSQIIFVFVNALFLLKYLERYSSLFIFMTLLGIFVYSYLFKTNTIYLKITKSPQLFYIGFTAYIIIALLAQHSIPVEKLNVDRWSVISSFWETYFNHDYAYNAISHMGNPPGPMPVYFILNLPFYVLGETGLFSIFGLIVFLIILKKNSVHFIKPILLTLLSVFTCWEIITRSNIFANAVLIIGLILYILRATYTTKQILFMGLLTGLALSTRNVFVIPILITFLFLIKTKRIHFNKLLLFGVVSVVFFILSFVPFVWGHFDEFLITNPFSIQSSGLMPFYLSFFFILTGFYFGFKCKSEEDVIFFSGLNLFLTILGYFLYIIIVDGFTTAFLKSTADISYFIMCIPFLLVYCTQKKLPVSNGI